MAALAAFQAFAKAGADFSGELLLVVVSGDLDGGCGSLAAIRRGYTADYAILPAPTSTGSIVAEKVSWFLLHISRHTHTHTQRHTHTHTPSNNYLVGMCM